MGIKRAALGVIKSIMALTNGTLSKLAIGSSAVMVILKAAVVNASTAKLDASNFVSIGSPFKLPIFCVKFSKVEMCHYKKLISKSRISTRQRNIAQVCPARGNHTGNHLEGCLSQSKFHFWINQSELELILTQTPLKNLQFYLSNY